MRFLHTSDWHVGVFLGGKDRTHEHALFLEELIEIIIEEKIDAVLISGDLFDAPNPPAESEKLVYDFFRKMVERRIPVVLIAGNHDSGARIDGKAKLLELVHVHAFGKPQRSASIEILTQRGESLIVAALPFAGDLRMLDWDDSMRLDQGQQRGTFAERMGQILSILSRAHFKPHAVNALMAHLTVDGAALSGSEKSLRMSDTWTIPPTMFPSEAGYVALGHIHKAQQFSEGPPMAYSGSPLYIDFGEEKDEKGVYIVEAVAGRPPKLEFRKLQRLTRVKTVRTSLKNLEKSAALFQGFDGHVKVVVDLEDDKRARVAEDVRKLLPQTVIVNLEAPKPVEERILPNITTVTHHPVQAYRLYLESQNRSAAPELIDTFQNLMEEAIHATSDT